MDCSVLRCTDPVAMPVMKSSFFSPLAELLPQAASPVTVMAHAATAAIPLMMLFMFKPRCSFLFGC